MCDMTHSFQTRNENNSYGLRAPHDPSMYTLSMVIETCINIIYAMKRNIVTSLI